MLIDTLKAKRHLTGDLGIPDHIADGIVETVSSAGDQVATKEDIGRLGDRLSRVKSEIEGLRESMVTKADLKRMALEEKLEQMATKEDLERFATKEDLAAVRREMATKEDLERFATKEDLAALHADMATKKDLERFATEEDLERELERFVTKEYLLRNNRRLAGFLVASMALLLALFEFVA